MHMHYYKFNINLTSEQKQVLLDLTDKMVFTEVKYGDLGFRGNDTIDSINSITGTTINNSVTGYDPSAIPLWLPKLFNFHYKRIIFLKNKGVSVHKDLPTRSSAITFPLNVTNIPTKWWKDGKVVAELYHNSNSYLTNVGEFHSVDPCDSYRYFMQLTLDNTWDYNVEYFKNLNLIEI